MFTRALSGFLTIGLLIATPACSGAPSETPGNEPGAAAKKGDVTAEDYPIDYGCVSGGLVDLSGYCSSTPPGGGGGGGGSPVQLPTPTPAYIACIDTCAAADKGNATAQTACDTACYKRYLE